MIGKAMLGLVQLLVVLGVALFAPAWTLAIPPAWAYLAIFGISSGLITAFLARHDTALLDRRIRAGPRAESNPFQKWAQAAAALAFIGIFVVASLDHRFGYSNVPLAVAIAGEVAVALGFFIVFLVFRENTFASATIEVVSNQIVVATGPYAVVRHPMYAGALILLIGTPLALGSWWALCLIVPLTVILVARLIDEENVLAANLPGYSDFMRSVRYRLIPGIW